MANKPYKITAGDLNEKAGGDQEMAIRAESARIKAMNTPARQTAVSAAIAKTPYKRPPMSAKMSQYTNPITKGAVIKGGPVSKNAPFTGGSTYRKP